MTNIERTELLAIEHADTPTRADRVGRLKEEYHALCARVKRVQLQLDELLEFLALVHAELHYINDAEVSKLKLFSRQQEIEISFFKASARHLFKIQIVNG